MLLNKEIAYEALMKILDLKERVIDVRRYGYHCFIETRKGRYYCLFKRAFFMTFQKEFPQLQGQGHSAIGESINLKALRIALLLDAKLVFIHQPDSFYQIYPAIVKKFCEQHNLIRTQEKPNIYKMKDYSGCKEVVREVTYCFPVNLLMSFEV